MGITEKEKNNPMIITKILFLLEFVFGESGARMFDPGLGHCNSHQYPCQGTNLCISMRKVCDCSVDCPNGDDELECPAELMSIIEAEVDQCIKPTPIEGTIDGMAVDGACREEDFDQQRDCICTIQNTMDCASPTGREHCVPTHLKAPDKPCCLDKEFFCHSKNQTQIHSRQKNGPNVIMSTSRKGTICHQIDVMTLLLHVIIGRRYPIAEMSPVTHTGINIVHWISKMMADPKKLLK